MCNRKLLNFLSRRNCCKNIFYCYEKECLLFIMIFFSLEVESFIILFASLLLIYQIYPQKILQLHNRTTLTIFLILSRRVENLKNPQFKSVRNTSIYRQQRIVWKGAYIRHNPSKKLKFFENIIAYKKCHNSIKKFQNLSEKSLPINVKRCLHLIQLVLTLVHCTWKSNHVSHYS